MNQELLHHTRERRRRFMQAIGAGAILIPGAKLRTRNADSHYPFRQDSDFHYLTGFDEPDALCVLFPEKDELVLFVPPRDPTAETWTGRRAGIEGAQQVFGANKAYSNADIDKELPRLLADAAVLHYAIGSRPDIDALVATLLQAHRKQHPRTAKGIARLEDPSRVLHEMRLIKEPFEVACLRQAVQATHAGHLRILQESRQGMFEYELQAMLEYEFRVRGASGPAYSSIVGCGANATILHYITNDCELTAGALVLVDAGAEFGQYAADVTRTFPVDAQFTAEQRALYEIVLEAQQNAIDTVRPGASFVAPHDNAVRRLCEGLLHLKLLTGPLDRIVESGDYRRFYMHRTSHWLGLDVHDAGRYRDNESPRTLAAGMVLTVEPGIYIPSDCADVPKAFRGMGIRIEDDVLVTAAGHEVLTESIPKKVAEIEQLRQNMGASTGEEKYA